MISSTIALSILVSAVFPLSTGGTSSAKIVTVASPSTYLSTCATEISNHVKLVTGASLQITNDAGVFADSDLLILVGSNAYTAALGYNQSALGWEQAYLDIRTNRVVLLGKDSGFGDDGSQYSTYTFLRDYLGVRWYFPGSLGTFTPSTPSVSIDTTNRIIRPWFSPRKTPGVMGSGLPVTSTELKTWGRRNRAGGADIFLGHTFYLLLPEVPWVSSNPEYYALKADGVTRWLFNVPDPKNVQLDLSNHVALASIITNQAIAFFEASPTNRFFTVMPGDSFGTYKCNCGYCLALYDDNTPGISQEDKHARYVFGFVNEVASLLTSYSNRFISCNGYGSYRWPYPTNMVMQTNVVVPITFNRVGFGYQLGDAMDDVSRWTNIQQNRLMIDENYYSGVVAGGSLHVWEGAPRICTERIKEETSQRANHVQGEPQDVSIIKVSGQTTYYMWLLDMVNLYVISELDWDPSQDVDELVDRFCDDLFGPASGHIRDWIRIAEDRWTQSPARMGITYYQEPSELWGSNVPLALSKCWFWVYPPAVIQQLREKVEDAKAVATGVELTRVELWESQCQGYIEQTSSAGRRTAVSYGPRIITGKITIGQ